MKKVVIGIDIDDCVCNTIEMDFACAYYKYKKLNKIPKNLDKNYLDVTKSFNMEDGDSFFINEKKYIMKNTSMYPKVFAKEVINKLKQKNFKIVFITSRNNKYWNENALKYTKKWLKQYKIKYDKLYANTQDKKAVCLSEKIDIMIEDNKNFVQTINQSGINSILLTTSYNKDYQHQLNTFAENWLDIYSILAAKYNFEDTDIINL